MIASSHQAPIVLAAGGTGGHLFPAQALAEVLVTHHQRVVLLADDRTAKFTNGVLANLEIITIPSGTLGRGMRGKAKGIFNLVLGMVRARLLLAKLKPSVVVGFGGYPSFPGVWAATKMNIPTVIHEQNALLGRANRLLAGGVSHIATSFPSVRMIPASAQNRQIMTGNPVRASIKTIGDSAYPLMQDGKLRILVTGGSQGATIFSEVIPEAIKRLDATQRARLSIVQQCREADLERVRSVYAELGVEAELSHFFADLPERLAGAHLLIGRSGASTVAELAASGRPSLLVPYPHATDQHQHDNARALDQVGGAWVIPQEDFTPASVSEKLILLLSNPPMLVEAARAAKSLGHADAASRLASLVMAAAEGKPVGKQSALGEAKGSLSSQLKERAA